MPAMWPKLAGNERAMPFLQGAPERGSGLSREETLRLEQPLKILLRQHRHPKLLRLR